MEARPRPLIEAVVGRLLPPACREHVLGDLHERYVSTGQYVLDAARTIPFVVWGQIRRNSSASLAIAEVSAVYIALLSALATLNPGALTDSSAPLRPAIPSAAVLVALVLRDAWIGRRQRTSLHAAADAALGVACAVVPQTVLIVVGSPLALPPNVCLSGSFMSVMLLSGVRIALVPNDRRAATADARGNEASSPSGIRGRLKPDLRRRWWTIAVLGTTVWLGLFLTPAFGVYRPILVAWLVVFVAIGIYQRRQWRN